MMNTVTEIAPEISLQEYNELLKNILKDHWKRGNYNIIMLSGYIKDIHNPPTREDFNKLMALIEKDNESHNSLI